MAVLVEEGEEKGMWQVFFDRDDDGLEGKLGKGRTILEVKLCRWGKRIRRGKPLGDMGS